MQNDPRFFAGQGGYGYPYGADEYHHNAPMGGYYGYGAPAATFFDPAPPMENGGVLNGVELQASVNCPENYVIFDQTDSRRRIMYNPAFGQNFNYPASQAYPEYSPTGYRNQPNTVCNRSSSSSFKEDSDEIDALLSLENDEEDEEEDDVVSTGRTPCKHQCDSPDSICSTGGSKSKSAKHKGISSSSSSPAAAAGESASAGTSKETKKERMKKMVKTLRGIVPGARQMDTPAFLDEAVRYLKSLKVEARKLGIKN